MSFATRLNNFGPLAVSISRRPARALVACAAVLCLLAGCETTRKPDPIVLVPVNSLAKQWALPLDLNKRAGGDSIRGIYLRDDTLYVYSQRNLVTAIAAVSGKPIFAAEVTPNELPLRPPVIVKDNVAFPASSSIEVYTKAGKKVISASTDLSIRSPGTALNNTIYIGLDYPAGGRLAAIDLTRRFSFARWQIMSRAGISSAPAVYQNNIYYADEAGVVYAVSDDQRPIWVLEHSAFKTDGRIVADLKSDEGAIYVASGDSKLYCLEAASGRLRWQYYSGAALVESPVITTDTVYQTVPNMGVVAIDRAQGQMNRDAKWIVKGATRFLSQDEKYVYLRGPDNRILACDRASGEVKFRSKRDDLVAFAINTKTPIIYAATTDGMVMGIIPVTKPGTVGAIVQAAPADRVAPMQFAAASATDQ